MLAKVQLGEFDVFHDFVVKKLVTSVILRIDFLQQNELILDFNQTPVAVHKTSPDPLPSTDPFAMSQIIPIYEKFLPKSGPCVHGTIPCH